MHTYIHTQIHIHTYTYRGMLHNLYKKGSNGSETASRNVVTMNINEVKTSLCIPTQCSTALMSS